MFLSYRNHKGINDLCVAVADTLLDLGQRYTIKRYAVVNVDELDLTVVAVKVELMLECMK